MFLKSKMNDGSYGYLVKENKDMFLKPGYFKIEVAS